MIRNLEERDSHDKVTQDGITMRKNYVMYPLIVAAALLFLISALPQAHAADSLIAKAKSFVQKATGQVTKWRGPTSGPKAQPNKSIVYVSADQTNSGAREVGEGVEQAADAIGWKLRLIDGKGTVSGRAKALSQAIALRPDGIVLGAMNVVEDASAVRKAHKLGISIVGWHSTANPGPNANPPLFTNVATPAEMTAKATAYLAIAKSDGDAKVIIFTDSAYKIALAKSSAMAKLIKQCRNCKLLKLRTQSLSSAMTDMPRIASSYLQRYGSQWTYTLAINDLYYDGMTSTLRSAGLPPKGPPFNISAGDGSQSAIKRIRKQNYQYATIPEPLHMHGWQIVDELNRAFAGDSPSGFVAHVHIITPKDVKFIGSNDVYDPNNNYRKHYRQIWGKLKR